MLKCYDFIHYRDNLLIISPVRTATESEEGAVIDALKLAFVDDPATRWVWPHSQKYLLHFSKFAKAFGGRSFVNKAAHYIGNNSSSALWLPPKVDHDVDTILGLIRDIHLKILKSSFQSCSRKWAAIIQMSLLRICHF
jgi:hypothetical protein